MLHIVSTLPHLIVNIWDMFTYIQYWNAGLNTIMYLVVLMYTV